MGERSAEAVAVRVQDWLSCNPESRRVVLQELREIAQAWHKSAEDPQTAADALTLEAAVRALFALQADPQTLTPTPYCDLCGADTDASGPHDSICPKASLRAGESK